MAQVPTSDFDFAQLPDTGQRKAINVLVVSSVALAFISFWRAAAIVLCDLASTAYYIGGISEQAIGKAAPWFILGVMLFSYAVRAVYVESCTMFTRGGVYRVVKGAIGGGLAKLSVSALMFDYILTGPISAVSAGQYMLGLFVDMMNVFLRHIGHPPIVTSGAEPSTSSTPARSSSPSSSPSTSGASTSSESTNPATKPSASCSSPPSWASSSSAGASSPSSCTISRCSAPPLHPVFTDSGIGGNESSKGWLEDFPRIVGALGILIAFGHTLLAMSGEESLAQVNREIEAPKLKNLLRAGFVIFLYSMLLTSLISFFAIFIIPDGKRVMTMVVQNGSPRQVQPAKTTSKSITSASTTPSIPTTGATDLIAGSTTKAKNTSTKPPSSSCSTPITTSSATTADIAITSSTASSNTSPGPPSSKSLWNVSSSSSASSSSPAPSTPAWSAPTASSIASPKMASSPRGSSIPTNASEPPIGSSTSSPSCSSIVIVASSGDVDTLGEAYAFGVIWSFVFMTMSMAFLRLKDRSPRQYRVPLQHPQTHQGTRARSPHRNLRRLPHPRQHRPDQPPHQENRHHLGRRVHRRLPHRLPHRRKNLPSPPRRKARASRAIQRALRDGVSIEALGLKHPKPVVIAARGPHSLPVLQRILQEVDTTQRDVVVVTCKVLPARTFGVTPQETSVDESDRDLLTKIVTIAEQVGKEVHPVVLPTNNPLFAIATAARDLKANEVVLGVSEKMHAETQLEQFALAWGSATADPMYSDIAHDMTVRVVGPQVEMRYQMD